MFHFNSLLQWISSELNHTINGWTVPKHEPQRETQSNTYQMHRKLLRTSYPFLKNPHREGARVCRISISLSPSPSLDLLVTCLEQIQNLQVNAQPGSHINAVHVRFAYNWILHRSPEYFVCSYIIKARTTVEVGQTPPLQQ